MSDAATAGPGPEQPAEVYELRLYVAGQTPKSVAAFNNMRRLCEEQLDGRCKVEAVGLLVNPREARVDQSEGHPRGRYDLAVIDLYQQPGLARGEQIVAAPTLVKRRPLPARRLVGDLSRTERVLAGLDIRPRGVGGAP